MADNRFEAALRDARQTGDWSTVISMYVEAAEGHGEGNSEAFYLTHAYIHALEAGDVRADHLKARLVTLGAEVQDPS